MDIYGGNGMCKQFWRRNVEVWNEKCFLCKRENKNYQLSTLKYQFLGSSCFRSCSWNIRIFPVFSMFHYQYETSRREKMSTCCLHRKSSRMTDSKALVIKLSTFAHWICMYAYSGYFVYPTHPHSKIKEDALCICRQHSLSYNMCIAF